MPTDIPDFPEIIHLTRDQADHLTLEQALDVLKAARRLCVIECLHQEDHFHMGDDCGDYLYAATDNWNRLFHAWFDNDGNATAFVMEVKDFLLEHPEEWMGSDGEIRFSIFSDAYVEAMFNDTDPGTPE